MSNETRTLEERRELKKRCKELFFQNYKLAEIIKDTGCNLHTLRHWAYDRTAKTISWQDQRRVESDFLRKDVADKNAEKVNSTLETGFSMIQYAIEQRATLRDARNGKQIPLSLKEARVLTDILTSLDKFLKLSAGEATEITKLHVTDDLKKVKPAGVDDLRHAILNDPFISNNLASDQKAVILHKISNQELESKEE